MPHISQRAHEITGKRIRPIPIDAFGIEVPDPRCDGMSRLKPLAAENAEEKLVVVPGFIILLGNLGKVDIRREFNARLPEPLELVSKRAHIASLHSVLDAA
jgi:hypothetical protein